MMHITLIFLDPGTVAEVENLSKSTRTLRIRQAGKDGGVYLAFDSMHLDCADEVAEVINRHFAQAQSIARLHGVGAADDVTFVGGR